jgi:CheY-like chemotaxis protein
MENEVIILIAEDDEGHASLLRKNLKRAGIDNEIMHFQNGEEVLNFLFNEDANEGRIPDKPYLLLLDIRMPKVDGIEVLRKIKQSPKLKKMPVIMVTTTDDPKEVVTCHELGCNNYIAKPIDYDKFVEAIKQLGMFLKVVLVPRLD